MGRHLNCGGNFGAERRGFDKSYPLVAERLKG